MTSTLKKPSLFWKLLNTTACFVAVTAFAHDSHAAPEGSLIVGGAATVNQTGLNTIVNQTSNRAIIKWNSFDVGQPESVTFQQPSANSITVNRITDTKASQIDGKITSNGKLVMINPNGIAFGATSRVDVGSLVATTSDLENDVAFMAGGPAKFTKAGNPNASIINAGTITAREAGLIGLVAPNVENKGIIQAKLGKVQLASGDIHTIDLAGDGLIQLEVSDQVFTQSVKNTGTIQADGGDVLMTAAQGKAALDAIISNHGRIQTGTVFALNGTTIKKGTITIAAPTKAKAPTKIIQGGTLLADGGDIQLIADSITLEGSSNISVASDHGGGSVLIGGAKQGGTSLPTAQFLNVESGSVIDASALGLGNGGDVVLWSDQMTSFSGKIISEGGALGGNGGDVEVSSKGRLNYKGFVDLTAASGHTGNLLLDPTDILITSAPDQNMSAGTPFTPTVDDGPSILDVATLQTALGSASVTVQTRATGTQAGNITVNAPLTWASGNTLTLDAHHDVIINQAVSGQNLTLIAGNDTIIDAPLTGTGLLTIMTRDDNQTMGVGSGSLGTLQVNSTELGFITNGWANLIFGRDTSNMGMEVRTANWNDNVTFRSGTGTIKVSGSQNSNTNNISFTTNGDIDLINQLNGSGTLTFATLNPALGIGVGTGQAGAIQFTDAELAFLIDNWSLIEFGQAGMSGNLNMGAFTWLDNLSLKTGSGILSINGTQNMGANTLTIQTNSNPVINADLVGTGVLNLYPGLANISMGLGNGASGTFNLDTTEFNHIKNGWANLFIGRADSSGSIDIRALTWQDPFRILSGTGVISINGAQNFGSNTAVYQTDTDIAINASLTGTANLAFLSNLGNVDFGIADAPGTIDISSAELDFIQDGFNLIQFGSGAVPQANPMNIGAYTWRDNVLFSNTSGQISFGDVQNFGSNNLTIRTNSDLDIGANLIGTGILTIAQQSVATEIGVGTGQSGSLSLNNADLSNIVDGWSNIVIGRTDSIGAIHVGANSWNDNLTLQSGAGIIDIAGTQTMGANNLTVTTDSDVTINAPITGTGILTIQGANAATTVGVGSGQAGALALNATDLGNITNGWTNIVIGRTDGTGAVNVGANTWNDNLTLQSGAGIITIGGAQTLGANNLTISSASDAQINAPLTGTGTITLQGSSIGTTIGVGTGQTGVLQLSNADLANITNGWTNIVIGRTDGTGAVNVGANAWNDDLTLQSATGIITVGGIQTMGVNNLTLSSDTSPLINAGLTGTGNLTLRGNSASTTMGLGTGQAGGFQLTDASIANITNGWSNITIGRTDGTGAISIGALTWNDNLTLQSLTAPIIIAGTQTLGANNVIFNTNGDPQINAAMNSTGTLTFQGLTDATTIGVGTGQAGTVSIDTTDLNNADNTWTNIIIGRTTQTGAMNVGNFTLADPLQLQTASGVITVGAAINMGANNLVIQTDANPVINAGISGTQTIYILPNTATTTIGVGTGQAGTISLTDAEQANILNGWNNIVFGRINASGAINFGPNLTWNDNLFIRTIGAITIAGTQNFGANSLNVQTDANPVINGDLNGTGTFILTQIANGTSIGLGNGQTGTLNLDDAELDHITNGWISLAFGLTTSTADLNVGAYSWNDPLSLRTGSGIININGAQTMAANNLTIQTDANLNIGAALTGTGTLTITPNNNISMGLGTGQTGTLGLTDTELDNITDGWGNLVFGLTTSTQPVNIGAYTWRDNVTIRNGSGVMTVAGVQNMGANSLTLLTDGNLALNGNLSGTGILTISPNGNTTVGVGTGQSGTLSLTDTELNRIQDGWTGIVIGNAASTAAMNVGTRTWTDPLTLRTGSGVMTIAGNQTMGANNLNLQTDGNLALTGNLAGTGILNIRGASNGTSIGLGNGQTGTLNLTDAEILRIVDGWTRIDFGHSASTGVINVGASTWNDPVRHITNTGVITVNGVQTMGANDLTIQTDANPTFNAALKGTGTLTILGTSAATTMGIGDAQTGTLQLSNSDLAYVSAGWGNIIFGYNGMTGAMNVGAYNWQYDTAFRSGTGVISVNGVQNSGSKNMSFETDGNLAINAAIQGNGTLSIRGSANATSMGIGTGQTGTLGLTDTELNFLSDGWSKITMGHANSTGAMNVGARTWNDPLHLITDTGLMTIAGIQTMGANNLTLETNSNLAINANLNGSGNLIIRGQSTGTSIGINGAAGTLALSTTEIARITDGWNSVTIGRQDMMGDISLNAAVWQNPTTFLTRGNVNLSGVQTSTETGGTSLVFVTQAGSFNNTVGAGAINPGGGRYVIYAVDAASTTLGGLAPVNTIMAETYFSLPPGSVAAGNSIVYSDGAAKVLYLQIDDKFKVYGDGLPTFTYTYLGGLLGSDTLGAALTGYTLNANGTGLTDNAGTTWAITGSFLTALGYSTNVTDGILTVVKAPVLVQANNETRTYGAANPTFTINYIGLKNGETSSVIDTLASASTPATVLSNVGTYTISTTGASDNNYIFNYAPNTLTITKANLTVTADDKTREYGDANPTFTYSYSGFMNGDGAGVIDTLPTASTTATATTSPTTTAISMVGGTDNNYNLILVNGVLTITKANLTVTADNKSRTYGDPNPALTYTFGAFKNGETSAVLGSLPTASTTATNTTNAGTAAISVSGGLDTNYNYVYVDGVLTINKATLTATAQNVSRAYGDANPTFPIVYSGFKNSETSAVIDTLATASTTATASSGAGTAPITPSGALDNNYDFNYVNGILTINKADLTVTADNKTREYGDANPTLTYTFGSFKNGENSSVLVGLPTISTTATTTTNAGTAAITLSGGSGGNYNYVFTNGTLTITKATLTATAQDTSREYGDVNPTFAIGYTGFKNGETASVIDTLATASSTATTAINAGTTAAITPTGAIDNNYNFTYVNGTLTINKANLNVTADNKTREYGDANPTLTYTFGPFKNGQNSSVLGALPTISTTANTTTGVGTAAITVSGGSDSNYNYVFTNGVLTITKATLTATAQNASRDYGDANPIFAIGYTGFKNGETASVIDTLATATTTATNATNVGTAVITPSGAIDDNYDFSYVNGTLTINKADLTITADNKTREYGDANPALTYTFGSFKNGQNSSVLGALPTISTAGTTTTNAGTAAITLSGGSDSNYNYVFTNGVLTITKATLTATAQNTSREYGDVNPTFAISYTGFKNGETASVIDTLATASSSATTTDNAGTTWAITPTGANDNNYDFSYVNGTLTIDKANLNVTADNKTREYGDANPALTYTFGSFKNGENASVLGALPTISTAATTTTNAGTAAITLTGGSDTNYNYVLTNGTLTITKANLNITADDKTREYGDANPTLTYTFGSFKNGETSAVLGTLPTISTAATSATNAGTAAITLTGGSDTNYNYVMTDGTLTITKANLNVTADNKTREYGDANPSLTYTFGSFKNGQNSSVLAGLPTISTAATNITNAGTAAITLSGGSDSNYNYVFTNGVLTITKATLTATAQNTSREYGDVNPTFAISYTGFKNGETASVIDTLATASSSATTTDNAGTTWAITPTGANDNNYDFSYVNGTLTIDKANLNVTADNKTREYGDANPALTYTFGSFKNGENASVLGALPTISTAATTTTNAGTAAITLTGGSASNYNLVLNNGVLTIAKAALNVQIEDATRAEGGPNPSFSYTILSGLKNGDADSVLTGVSFGTGTTIYTPRGTYVINGAGGVATNYYVSSFQPGVLTITPGNLPIRALPSTVYYTTTLGIHEGWNQWRDLIYYEDDEYIESILFGRQVKHRKHAAQNTDEDMIQKIAM